MTEVMFTETPSGLVELARRHGFDKFSEPRLKRLRLDRLLPTHRRIEGRWSYPEGTARQLLGLLTIERMENLNSHTQLGWRAWWFGWSVDEKYWVPLLHEAATWWDKGIAEVTKQTFTRTFELTERGFQFIDQIKDERYWFKPFRQLRKRLGRHFESFMVMLLKLAIGRFEALPPQEDGVARDAQEDDAEKDAQILDRGLGLDEARKNRLPNIKPWLVGDISSELQRLSKSLRGVSLAVVLSQSTLAEIDHSRHELVTILCYIVSSYENLKQKRGLHAFGFGVISRFLNLGWPKLEAMFILLFHAAKRDEIFSANVTAFVKALLANG